MSTAKVFVGSLPPGCKPDELRRLFSNYGAVVECDVMNRCGFVHLENTEMADAAIAALNGIEFKGQNIVVEPGRPKERGRKGVGVATGPGAGNRGGRRPMQQGHGHGGETNKGPLESRSTHRGGGGGGQPNFGRASGGRGGGSGDSRESISNGNNFGPIRNDRNYSQQRNAPYRKGSSQQQSHHSEGSAQGFKNRFSAGGSGGTAGSNRFAGTSGGNGGFNNSPGNRFGGHNQQYQQWDNNSGSHSNAVQGGRRNFKHSPSSGFSGNNQQNDSQSGHSGSGGSSNGNQRGGGLGPSANVRQDRRGFALPADHHHQQQQQPVSFGGNQSGRFGNGLGPMRSDNPVMNSGNHQGGRPGFSPNRGNFGGRGGFNARSSNNERGMSQNQGPGGGFNKRGSHPHSQNQNALTAYQAEFPPLGPSHGPRGSGQRNRFSGPRQGSGPNMGGNRRF
ncbi:uncharacterized protein Dwil_GK14083 [Drosophila willistoni]|uniref:RRM domain-containing protein n=1 Tax=Drosophila willistoni TaxID=7260 RepID=B4NLD0_DROWI|nr:hornerin [Drosophila willistoni]EDW84333.1 uncharacterized protein Dwil_GK14083 [Drosophila willistoni]